MVILMYPSSGGTASYEAVHRDELAARAFEAAATISQAIGEGVVRCSVVLAPAIVADQNDLVAIRRPPS
jgi:hypothetical protein